MRFLVILMISAGLGLAAEEEQKERNLDVVRFKVNRAFLDSGAKPPAGLKVRYPELREAQKTKKVEMKNYLEAVREHPELKPQFQALKAKLKAKEINMMAYMKETKPLYEKAEKLEDLDRLRNRYHRARLGLMQCEINCYRAEGFTDQADRMQAVLDTAK